MIDDVLEKIVYMGCYILPSLDKYSYIGFPVVLPKFTVWMYPDLSQTEKKIPFLLSMSVVSVGVNVFLALSSLSKQ